MGQARPDEELAPVLLRLGLLLGLARVLLLLGRLVEERLEQERPGQVLQ